SLFSFSINNSEVFSERMLKLPKSIRLCSASPMYGLVYTWVDHCLSWIKRLLVLIPASFNKLVILAPYGSSPITPKARTSFTPIVARLHATLPAPPREYFCELTVTVGFPVSSEISLLDSSTHQ